ncbi:hypothetical protein, partial [Endozoicomonas sp.]|uniref:hypothetical protein n=1 Tax=Endozoicomonas sp. TaxID=1892382 RepID=UPI00383AF484
SLALSPEKIIQQEIALNEMLISIHRLQLDFLDQEARESLQQAQQTLNTSIHALPKRTSDPEANELITTVLTLWPVVSKHIIWLSSIPASTEPPVVNSLLRVLAKMDRQLLLLRQKAMNSQSGDRQKLRFLEQALLMQHMTRDYLSLLIAEQNTEVTISSQMQLKALTSRFDKRMTMFNEELSEHPHASQPVHKAYAAWAYIHSSFKNFPEQQAPDLIVRYSHRIVEKLFSIQRMF